MLEGKKRCKFKYGISSDMEGTVKTFEILGFEIVVHAVNAFVGIDRNVFILYR